MNKDKRDTIATIAAVLGLGMPDEDTIRHRVNAYRLHKGITIEELAEGVGMAKATYSKWMKGNTSLRYEVIMDILEYLIDTK